ncbi:hypothetical protein KAU45_08485 [bacterium]|nr:hypothetical protein [bacterium]
MKSLVIIMLLASICLGATYNLVSTTIEFTPPRGVEVQETERGLLIGKIASGMWTIKQLTEDEISIFGGQDVFLIGGKELEKNLKQLIEERVTITYPDSYNKTDIISSATLIYYYEVGSLIAHCIDTLFFADGNYYYAQGSEIVTDYSSLYKVSNFTQTIIDMNSTISFSCVPDIDEFKQYVDGFLYSIKDIWKQAKEGVEISESEYFPLTEYEAYWFAGREPDYSCFSPLDYAKYIVNDGNTRAVDMTFNYFWYDAYSEFFGFNEGFVCLKYNIWWLDENGERLIGDTHEFYCTYEMLKIGIYQVCEPHRRTYDSSYIDKELEMVKGENEMTDELLAELFVRIYPENPDFPMAQPIYEEYGVTQWQVEEYFDKMMMDPDHCAAVSALVHDLDPEKGASFDEITAGEPVEAPE